jgi:hypothetical protein
LQVGRQPQPQPELGVVLEQASSTRPGRGRTCCATTASSAGCRRRSRSSRSRSRWRCAVAEQLAEQLEVRGLAAAGAGPGELEQRLQELDAAHGAEVDPAAAVDRDRLEELDVRAGRLAVVHRRQVDGLAVGADPGTLTGQASTHRPQPVQSSAYTCRV